MKYLTVKVSISGLANGANVSYGARIRDVVFPSDYDEERLFDLINETIGNEEKANHTDTEGV